MSTDGELPRNYDIAGESEEERYGERAGTMVSLVIPNVVVFVVAADSLLPSFSFLLSLSSPFQRMTIHGSLPLPPSFLPSSLPPHWPHPLRSAMDMVEREGGTEVEEDCACAEGHTFWEIR